MRTEEAAAQGRARGLEDGVLDQPDGRCAEMQTDTAARSRTVRSAFCAARLEPRNARADA